MFVNAAVDHRSGSTRLNLASLAGLSAIRPSLPGAKPATASGSCAYPSRRRCRPRLNPGWAAACSRWIRDRLRQPAAGWGPERPWPAAMGKYFLRVAHLETRKLH